MKTARIAAVPGVADAQALIRARGERLTLPRAAVLAVLLGSDAALSHHEVEAALRSAVSVDRVTVYRVLEWLVETSLAHRVAGEDRTWRFGATPHPGGSPHAHFTCTRCGHTVCLASVGVPKHIRVPAGFRAEALELTVRGRCARCSGATRPTAAA
jgi:Fur family ferric uptake transcriptional regulator